MSTFIDDNDENDENETPIDDDDDDGYEYAGQNDDEDMNPIRERMFRNNDDEDDDESDDEEPINVRNNYVRNKSSASDTDEMNLIDYVIEEEKEIGGNKGEDSESTSRSTTYSRYFR